MDLVTANASGHETDHSRIYAQSKMIRMDEVKGDKVENTMIFLGNELLAVERCWPFRAGKPSVST
jgi:hypothetical protein